MKRVTIIGSPGSGKSTLARELGGILDIPHFHMDHISSTPEGKPRPREEAAALIADIVNAERWIIEGHHYDDGDVRLEAADTIVFLNFSRYLCLWRYLRRMIRYYGKASPGNYIVERIDRDLLRGFKFVFLFPRFTTPRILKQLRHYEGSKTVYVLRNPSDVARFKLSMPNPVRPSGRFGTTG
ncbi:topology modulation protein [Paenibacillaceae bacterium WGS1546]|uniref:topology modulation protein n=1 Tax=Cohnella sp. WGS1546 TaxID=3366810 RepID=UPI00372D529F